MALWQEVGLGWGLWAVARLAYTGAVQFDDLFEHAMDYPGASAADEAAGTHFDEAGDASGDAAASATDSSGRWDQKLPANGGVYLLTDEADRLIQLASTGNLRRGLRLRLSRRQPEAQTEATQQASVEAFATKRRPDLREIVRRIRWQPGHSMFEITLDYWRIARELMPDAYLKNVAFGPAWFVHVDSSAAIPRFVAGKLLRSPPGVDLGPFATQADAARFVQILEDIFDLCRHHHILEQTPNGQPCAYFEMGRCAAPCDGSIGMSQYRNTISRALRFTSGQREEACREWESQMHAAARDHEFEQANRLKQRLERARALEHKAYRLVRTVGQFRYLIVQRGGGTTRVKPFFVRRGEIERGETVQLKELNRAAEQWIQVMREPDAGQPDSMQRPSTVRPELSGENHRRVISEQIWLVSHYMFKRETPGLFLHASELPGPSELAERIRERFRPNRNAPQEPRAPQESQKPASQNDSDPSMGVEPI